jgi:hypothetical protein
VRVARFSITFHQSFMPSELSLESFDLAWFSAEGVTPVEFAGYRQPVRTQYSHPE